MAYLNWSDVFSVVILASGSCDGVHFELIVEAALARSEVLLPMVFILVSFNQLAHELHTDVIVKYWVIVEHPLVALAPNPDLINIDWLGLHL